MSETQENIQMNTSEENEENKENTKIQEYGKYWKYKGQIYVDRMTKRELVADDREQRRWGRGGKQERGEDRQG